jgi:hypothetical protein
MNQHPQTLSEMFGLDEQHTDRSLDVIERSQCYKSLKEGKHSALPAAFWRGGAEAIFSNLQGAFDFPVASIFAGAWNKYSEFWKYTDRTKYSAGTTSYADLASHTIKSAHERDVDILFNGEKVGAVHFKLDLRIKLKATVTITDARFMAIRVGSLTLEGILDCEGAELIKRSSREYKSPFELDLGKGIPIVPSLTRQQQLQPADVQGILRS